MAALYDRVLAPSEHAGLAEIREDLLRVARGRVLEIGAGTGLNLAHYPAEIESLTLDEPDPFMARHLRDRLEDEPPPFAVSLRDESADSLEDERASYDTVVSTLVLCTVADPLAVLAEVDRVLKPDGQLLFLEHVRDPSDGRLGFWQDRLERPWRWVAGGCHPNRDTEATLRGAGFELDLTAGSLPKAAPLLRPMVRGVARRPAG